MKTKKLIFNFNGLFEQARIIIQAQTFIIIIFRCHKIKTMKRMIKNILIAISSSKRETVQQAKIDLEKKDSQSFQGIPYLKRGDSSNYIEQFIGK